MNAALTTLLTAAQRAPSGDNTQPWRFVVDEASNRVALVLDPARDPSPMNAGQRMARVALGAALENMLQTADRRGWNLCRETPDDPEALAQVRLHGVDPVAAEVAPAVAARVTNRRRYDSRDLAPQVLDRLRGATAEPSAIVTHWLADRGRLPELAALIGRADALMFGAADMRRAFLANVRFDRPRAEAVEVGLSLDALELSTSDRLALRCLRGMPPWMVHLSGALRQFAVHSQRLVASASGLCLVVAPDGEPSTDVEVGMALQRAWLALTAEGLAVQPMMSLPVLEGAVERDPRRASPKLEELRRRLRELLPELRTGRAAFLLRFGYAPPPSGRTGRLPLSAVTTRWSPYTATSLCLASGG